nr:hypothetical protein [Novosphingobium aureum]
MPATSAVAKDVPWPGATPETGSDARALGPPDEFARSRNIDRGTTAAALPGLIIAVRAGNGNDFVVAGRPDDDADTIPSRRDDDYVVCDGLLDSPMERTARNAAQAHRDHMAADPSRMGDSCGNGSRIEDLHVIETADGYELGRRCSAGNYAARAARQYTGRPGSMPGVCCAIAQWIGWISSPVQCVPGQIESEHVRLDLVVRGNAAVGLSNKNAFAPTQRPSGRHACPGKRPCAICRRFGWNPAKRAQYLRRFRLAQGRPRQWIGKKRRIKIGFRAHKAKRVAKLITNREHIPTGKSWLNSLKSQDEELLQSRPFKRRQNESLALEKC